MGAGFSMQTLYFCLLALLSFIAPIITAATAHHGRCSRESSVFDFIIVGGGTAGSALASRLSERLPHHCILLLEAGSAALDDPRITVPGLRGSLHGSELDWNLTTVRQAHADGRQIPQARAKVLGGSSAMHQLIWDRAAAEEYDVWEELGNPGWNWQSMREYMLRVENFTADLTRYDGDGVGQGGPVGTSMNSIDHDQQKAWIAATKSLGVEYNSDSLNGKPLGVGYQPSCIEGTKNIRQYAANTYLRSAAMNGNLMVLMDSRVRKIQSRRGRAGRLVATAVSLLDGRTFKARREIILSAGALQSPQLLELSGIGRPDVLASAGVLLSLRLDGVGENLQDHVYVETAYQLKPGSLSHSRLTYDPEWAADQMNAYKAGNVSQYDYAISAISFQTWSDIIGNDSTLLALASRALASDPSPIASTNLAYLTRHATSVPALELLFNDGHTGPKPYPATSSTLYGQDFFAITAILMHPLSRGTVHITTSNISDHPAIDPHYLEHEYDVAALIAGLKRARQIAQTSPLAEFWVDEYVPGLETTTDEQWREYVKQTASTLWHSMGTCAMLPREDGGAVDAQLKVYGTENLRVVDASVIPVILSAHPQTAIYGIAEKAADIIVGIYG